MFLLEVIQDGMKCKKFERGDRRSVEKFRWLPLDLLGKSEASRRPTDPKDYNTSIYWIYSLYLSILIYSNLF